MNKIYRFTDGSRLEILEDIKRDFPLSIDLKITDFCPHHCPWCHESSGPRGVHGEVSEILDHLEGLPSGTEIAIGGGNPLCHPGLQEIINGLKDFGYIVNMTVRDKDLDLHGVKGISGLGVSISEDGPDPTMLVLPPYSVAHLILGVTSAETYREVKKVFSRILWLGYKSRGRGEKYKPESLENISREITKDLYQGQGVTLAFDNLAISQLDLGSRFLRKEWKLMYLGPEFTSSMYVDAVKGEYSESSTSPERVSWGNVKLINYFKDVTNNTKPV